MRAYHKGLNLNLLYPLNEFYDESRLPLPSVNRVEDQEIPEPCRGILVHDRDMTPTLEDTYGRGIELHVLKYSLRQNIFSRQIVLTLEGDQISAITWFADSSIFPKFGLPRTLR